MILFLISLLVSIRLFDFSFKIILEEEIQLNFKLEIKYVYSLFCSINIFDDKFNSIKQNILIENNFAINDLTFEEKSIMD